MNHLNDRDLAAHALRQWANYVETGDIIYNSADFCAQGRLPKALSEDQQRFVMRLRDLAKQSQIKGVE